MATQNRTPEVDQNGYLSDESNVYPPHHGMTVGQYFASRIKTLKPPMNKAPNPIRLLMMLSRTNWNFFFIAFWGWTWDAFDFFSVSLTTTDLANSFGVDVAAITLGITLVLLLRSVGSIIFGIAADRYGRKWPFIINCALFIVIELATGFVQTYQQFLGVRALFGIAMGGIYGNAASTALEDIPDEARGLISGMLQQGYAVGYLLATAFARGLVDTTSHGWRPLYWFGAAIPSIFIVWRLFLPETNTYIARQNLNRESGGVGKVMLKEGKVAIRHHWLVLVYMVLIMVGFNFMAHGSQDLYPTLLKSQLGFNANKVTITQVVANIGAVTGGTTVGYCSQIFGRRFSIIAMCILGGALLYPYTFLTNERIIAAAFFEQFAVQGAWGVVPVHLMELSPGAFRAFTVGTAYQLGNLVSSASAQIEATIGERYPLTPLDGQPRYNYGKVIAILMGAVYGYMLILTVLGPEHLGRKMDVTHDANTVEATGGQNLDDKVGGIGCASHSENGDVEKATT
ncbi:lactate/pyruvate transporter [Xylariaceae sp. FL0255]|nr:lactate/pyruvate transporter [Xylariaceae sp. FL0255]